MDSRCVNGCNSSGKSIRDEIFPKQTVSRGFHKGMSLRVESVEYFLVTFAEKLHLLKLLKRFLNS